MPLIATATTTRRGPPTASAAAIFTGLAYPIGVCVLTVAVGGLSIRETPIGS